MTRFALKMREGEEYCAYQTFAKMGVPILGTIQGNGFIEGGSFCMLNRRTALIGRSVRVNQEGIGQLEQILSWQGIELVTVDLLRLTRFILMKSFNAGQRDCSC
ncbi:hypothetical protein QKW52_27085 [Bacillus sonorensis]|nr:hypothetical protein [Bacillus sonorensis]